jgi:hypothetical protein
LNRRENHFIPQSYGNLKPTLTISNGIELGGVVYYIGGYYIAITVNQLPLDQFSLLTQNHYGQ